MPLPHIPVPKFPNVPPLPGVPPLLRDVNAFVTNQIVGAQALVTRLMPLLGAVQGPRWGIFDDQGNAVITGQSVRSIEYRKEFQISDYPVEDGGFETYNKVETPWEVKLTFLQGGSDRDRQEFLVNCEDVVSDHFTLYSAVTPERTYVSATVDHMDYRRTETNGATLLQVDLWLREVRETATEEFSNTKMPEGADTVSGGAVQPVPVPPGTNPFGGMLDAFLDRIS